MTDLSDRIGSFRRGNEADFVVLNPEATPLLRFRTEKKKTSEELLGVLMMIYMIASPVADLLKSI